MYQRANAAHLASTAIENTIFDDLVLLMLTEANRIHTPVMSVAVRTSTSGSLLPVTYDGNQPCFLQATDDASHLTRITIE